MYVSQSIINYQPAILTSLVMKVVKIVLQRDRQTFSLPNMQHIVAYLTNNTQQTAACQWGDGGSLHGQHGGNTRGESTPRRLYSAPRCQVGSWDSIMITSTAKHLHVYNHCQ